MANVLISTSKAASKEQNGKTLTMERWTLPPTVGTNDTGIVAYDQASYVRRVTE